MEALALEIAKQGDLIKAEKAKGTSKQDLAPMVAHLVELKEKLKQLSMGEKTFDRQQLEAVLTKRFFIAPSFEIYGGVAGLFDYGPPGCALQNNILSLWRQHFVLEEDMLEVESTNLTPEEVLKTSGHVDRFVNELIANSFLKIC
jgi:glycyl-tRNA synthetase